MTPEIIAIVTVGVALAGVHRLRATDDPQSGEGVSGGG